MKKKDIQKGISDLLFPENIYCMCCGDLIDEFSQYGICDACMQKLQWRTEDVFTEETIKEHQFSQAFACVNYGGAVKELIAAFKYGGKPWFAKGMGRLMAERFSMENLKVDLVVPVPLHKEKQWKRGYNQAELLGKEIAECLNLPLKNCLQRKRKTAPMKNMSELERAQNVEGAFERLTEMEFQDKIILLVDDILTTGSTADSCAAELEKWGAKEIYVLSFAASVGKPKEKIE